MLYLHYTNTLETSNYIILCEINGEPTTGKCATFVKVLRGKIVTGEQWPIMDPKLYYPLTDLQKIELL